MKTHTRSHFQMAYTPEVLIKRIFRMLNALHGHLRDENRSKNGDKMSQKSGNEKK